MTDAEKRIARDAFFNHNGGYADSVYAAVEAVLAQRRPAQSDEPKLKPWGFSECLRVLPDDLPIGAQSFPADKTDNWEARQDAEKQPVKGVGIETMIDLVRGPGDTVTINGQKVWPPAQSEPIAAQPEMVERMCEAASSIPCTVGCDEAHTTECECNRMTAAAQVCLDERDKQWEQAAREELGRKPYRNTDSFIEAVRARLAARVKGER